MVKNQYEIIDERKQNYEKKMRGVFEKAEKVNNYFWEDDSIQHYSKFR